MRSDVATGPDSAALGVRQGNLHRYPFRNIAKSSRTKPQRLPSIPIIIKANISQSRRTPTDVMELIKHRPSVQLRNDARLFADTEETHRLQWSIAVCSLQSPPQGAEPSDRLSKLIPLIFEISIFSRSL